MRIYYITDWVKRYEVNEKNRPARAGDKLRSGRLNYVRLTVFGRSYGQGWRELSDKLKGVIPSIFECFGLFCKLLEIAADQASNTRGKLGTADQIAKLTGYRGRYKLRLQRFLDVLADPDLGWINSGSTRQVPELSGQFRTNQAKSRQSNTEETREDLENSNSLKNAEQIKPETPPARDGAFTFLDTVRGQTPKAQQSIFAATVQARISRKYPRRDSGQLKADLIAISKVAIQAAASSQTPAILAHKLSRHLTDLDRMLANYSNNNPVAVWVASR